MWREAGNGRRGIVNDTKVVQGIYGSIQELADFDRPEWIDMLPQRGWSASGSSAPAVGSSSPDSRPATISRASWRASLT